MRSFINSFQPPVVPQSWGNLNLGDTPKPPSKELSPSELPKFLNDLVNSTSIQLDNGDKIAIIMVPIDPSIGKGGKVRLYIQRQVAWIRHDRDGKNTIFCALKSLLRHCLRRLFSLIERDGSKYERGDA